MAAKGLFFSSSPTLISAIRENYECLSSLVLTRQHRDILDTYETLCHFPWSFIRIVSEETGINCKLLLQNSALHFPHPEKVEETPELLQRRKFLVMQQQKREYNKMVENIIPGKAEEEKREGVAFRDQISVGINIIISMATIFTACYFVLHAASGSRILGIFAGLFGMIVIMLVEVWLFLIKDSKMQESKEKKAKREIASSIIY